MRTPRVVELDPLSQTLANLAAGLVGVQIDALVFDRTPQPLDHDVVPPTTLAVHGDADLGVLEHLGEGIAGELASLVSVEDFRFSVVAYSVTGVV